MRKVVVYGLVALAAFYIWQRFGSTVTSKIKSVAGN